MRIHAITAKLPVHDAKAALAYYATTLDLAVTQCYEHDGAVVFAELRPAGPADTDPAHLDPGHTDPGHTDPALAEPAPVGLALQVKQGDAVDAAPPPGARSGVVLDLPTDAPDELAAAMVAAGGEVVFPVADQPYGSRQGRVRDPFGHEWIVGTRSTMTVDQIQAAVADGDG